MIGIRGNFLTAVGLTAALGALVAVRAGEAPDKSAYSLANPTPGSLLRELTTDRPDMTESPFTVDAGHVQLEMDLLNHTRNHLEGVRTREWGVAPFNLRVGILSDFELGIFMALFVRRTERAPGGAAETRFGFGDVTLRAKRNFRGNDGGALAFGVIVDVKLTTAARDLGNSAGEGAAFLPVNLSLGDGWEVGAMTGLNLRRRDDRGGWRAVWINTVTTSHGLTGDIGAYAEITSETGDGAPVAAFDTGLTFALGANSQLDAGVQIGLSRNADDAVCFVGLARRY